jgi:uncharacterized protein (DUF58 family)
MSFRDIFRRPSRAPQAPDLQGDSLTDLSKLRRLDRLSLTTSRWLRGQSAGERPSTRRLPSSDFREHRPYLPGDDLRHIDWNASARTEHVFVKLGERPREATIHVLLDNSASMNWGQPPKLLAARRLAGALGYLALNHGDRLSVVGLSDPMARFGPSHGKGRVPALLRFARDLPVTRHIDLAAAARRYTASMPRGGFAILLSDLLAVPDIQHLLGAFPQPTWQLLVLHVLHPAELDPSIRGEIEFQDIETGERANYDLDSRVLERYRAHAAEWCRRIEAACRATGASYIRLLSDWSLEQTVIPLLQRRGVVQRT